MQIRQIKGNSERRGAIIAKSWFQILQLREKVNDPYTCSYCCDKTLVKPRLHVTFFAPFFSPFKMG